MGGGGFAHEPVLLEEALSLLRPEPGGVYVDATLGGGGHARAILRRIAPDGVLVGVDRDPESIAHARRWGKEFAGRLRVVHGNFRMLSALLADLGLEKVDGVICDLGVSSPQLDVAERGFSYHADAPLDMRMDPGTGRTAAQWIERLEERELTRILYEYGEERWAARIAKFIVEERSRRPIATTGELAELVKAAIPAAARRGGPHPARRTFQALRIFVNDEFGSLQEFLGQAGGVLRTGGRVAVITFHSLEDRMVKRSFAEAARGCVCPPHAPVCTCGHRPTLQVVTRRPVQASEEEVLRNSRARSAKLRVAERL